MLSLLLFRANIPGIYYARSLGHHCRPNHQHGILRFVLLASIVSLQNISQVYINSINIISIYIYTFRYSSVASSDGRRIKCFSMMEIAIISCIHYWQQAQLTYTYLQLSSIGLHACTITSQGKYSQCLVPDLHTH